MISIPPAAMCPQAYNVSSTSSNAQSKDASDDVAEGTRYDEEAHGGHIQNNRGGANGDPLPVTLSVTLSSDWVEPRSNKQRYGLTGRNTQNDTAGSGISHYSSGQPDSSCYQPTAGDSGYTLPGATSQLIGSLAAASCRVSLGDESATPMRTQGDMAAHWRHALHSHAHCGCAKDDQNWASCGGTQGQCPLERNVGSNLCLGGNATLKSFQQNTKIWSCNYEYIVPIRLPVYWTLAGYFDRTRAQIEMSDKELNDVVTINNTFAWLVVGSLIPVVMSSCRWVPLNVHRPGLPLLLLLLVASLCVPAQAIATSSPFTAPSQHSPGRQLQASNKITKYEHKAKACVPPVINKCIVILT